MGIQKIHYSLKKQKTKTHFQFLLLNPERKVVVRENSHRDPKPLYVPPCSTLVFFAFSPGDDTRFFARFEPMGER